MFIIQNISNPFDVKCISDISEIIRHYPEFSKDTLYSFFTRQKLIDVENYKGYRIIKRELIVSKRATGSC